MLTRTGTIEGTVKCSRVIFLKQGPNIYPGYTDLIFITMQDSTVVQEKQRKVIIYPKYSLPKLSISWKEK